MERFTDDGFFMELIHEASQRMMFRPVFRESTETSKPQEWSVFSTA